MAKELTQAVVVEFLKLVSGTFTTMTIRSELNITTTEGKGHLRVILSRLCEAGVIAKTPLDGTYRKIEAERVEIDWESADLDNTLPLVLPFDIHKVCKIYPKSIIIVAGSKNEGKTAFLMKCAQLNYQKFNIDFYNSETGREQFKERMLPLNLPKPAPFHTWERYDNFGDAIVPENLSIIDYLDLNSEVYLVGSEIDAIFRKLTTGCAIIGLQKPPPTVTYVKGVKKVIERDLAYGGGFSAKRAVLYISLSSRKCKLVIVKTPANPKIVPANMTWEYDFDETGYFSNIRRYYGEPSELF